MIVSHFEQKAANGRKSPTLVICGEYVEIILGGKKGKVAFISLEDMERVSQYRWWPTLNSTRSQDGVRKEKWYAQGHVNGQKVYLHRFIQNFPQGLVVDHIDANGLNCTRGNLRNVTQAKNVEHCVFKAKSPCVDPFL